MAGKGVSHQGVDTYEGFGTDSMGYTPTETDRKATDWQTVAEVTQQQIEYMDARRVSHWPSYETPKRCIEDRVESPMLWIVVSIVVMVILMLLFRRW